MIAYIGPGGLLTAIGAFLALLAAVVLALFGFVWYPVKRLLRALRSRAQRRSEPLHQPRRSTEPTTSEGVDA